MRRRRAQPPTTTTSPHPGKEEATPSSQAKQARNHSCTPATAGSNQAPGAREQKRRAKPTTNRTMPPPRQGRSQPASKAAKQRPQLHLSHEERAIRLQELGNRSGSRGRQPTAPCPHPGKKAPAPCSKTKLPQRPQPHQEPQVAISGLRDRRAAGSTKPARSKPTKTRQAAVTTNPTTSASTKKARAAAGKGRITRCVHSWKELFKPNPTTPGTPQMMHPVLRYPQNKPAASTSIPAPREQACTSSRPTPCGQGWACSIQSRSCTHKTALKHHHARRKGQGKVSQVAKNSGDTQTQR